METELVHKAAEILSAVHRGAPPVDRLPEAYRPRSIRDAQQIADAVSEELALPVLGWKTYFPFKAAQPALLTPIYKVLSSPATITAGIARIRMIEPEVVFRATEDLPSRETPYSLDELGEVMEALPAFEVLALRFSDMSDLLNGPPDAVFEAYADNSTNGCFVVGDPVRDWRAIDFGRQRVVTTEDGTVISDVRGGHPVFDPSLLLATGVNLLHDRGGVRAGQIIGNHTVAGIFDVRKGSKIVSEFDDLGVVEATYEN